MRIKKPLFILLSIVMLSSLLILSGCSGADLNETNSSTESKNAQVKDSKPTANKTTIDSRSKENTMNEIAYTTSDGETGYLYIPKSVLKNTDTKVPMVLMMCCTGGEARSNAKACGWVDKALKEDIIVLAPNYNNYATYSETTGIVSAVKYAIDKYPVDASRVYATGFSNGGAMSVALSSEYPHFFAAISAYGWMVDMRDQDNAYDMPFQVIQGTKEYTYATGSGAMAIMLDEQNALRSLFLFNEMIDESVQADYDAKSYWGYVPDDMHSKILNGHEWQFNNFYKHGYTTPFAQFVLIDGARHQPNEHEAAVAWDFFKNYSRSKDGAVIEIK